MIIADGRGAAAPEDENVFLDLSHPFGEKLLALRCSLLQRLHQHCMLIDLGSRADWSR